ncbi:MAG: sigma-70 family RNA polymerase sigma factor [Bacilli bacterium]|nr:sigma-70 family RNA polymerase sigma factor [Bacilli bacterium]
MDYKKYNDYELIYEVREKDEASESILFNKYLPIIKKIASNYYCRYDYYGYDYDDFLQEAYIGFQKAIVNYDENKDNLFYTFVVICINRHLLSFCRNISNSNKNIANYNLEEIDDKLVIDPNSDMDLIMNNQYISELIKQLIYSLSFECGCILELKINGFTYSEIGLLLGMSSSTVEYKNRKSKQLLLKILNN